MDYVDTSVLVPLFIPEPDSTAVRGWFDRRPARSVAMSDWTLVEFASTIGIKVRTGALNRAQARSACGLMTKLAAESIRVITPTRDDYRRAAGYLARHELGLRAGGALHAVVARSEPRSRLVTFDRRLIDAGRKLGIRVVSPI